MESVPFPQAHPPLQERSTRPSRSAYPIPARQIPEHQISDSLIPACPVLDAPRPLIFWHLASFDAPTVAIVWSLAFAWAAGVRLQGWVPLLLALATWSVYVGDRLLDVRGALRSPAIHTLRERHYFHWRFRRILLPLAVAAACAAAILIFTFMPVVARERNSVLATAALAYFCGVHVMPRQARPAFSFRLPKRTKEFLVGLLFTIGCILPVWSRIHFYSAHSSSPHFFSSSVPLLWPFWIPAAFFAALAFLNCWLIARWESSNIAVSDAPFYSPAHRALVDEHPFRPGRFNSAVLLALVGLLLAFLAPVSQTRTAALLTAGAASALLLALLDSAHNRLTPRALRATADLVLLTPLLLLL
jgi:hypothetical protein